MRAKTPMGKKSIQLGLPLAGGWTNDSGYPALFSPHRRRVTRAQASELLRYYLEAMLLEVRVLRRFWPELLSSSVGPCLTHRRCDSRARRPR